MSAHHQPEMPQLPPYRQSLHRSAQLCFTLHFYELQIHHQELTN